LIVGVLLLYFRIFGSIKYLVLLLKESSHAESPSGENSSSDMDGSLDQNGDAKLEETEVVKTGVSKQQFDGPSREKQDEEEEDDDEGDEEEESETEMKDEGNGGALQQPDKSREEPTVQLQTNTSEKSAAGMQTDTKMITLANEEGTEADNQEKVRLFVSSLESTIYLVLEMYMLRIHDLDLPWLHLI
jgi:hypothetical protein